MFTSAMFLLILGISVFIVGFVLGKSTANNKEYIAGLNTKLSELEAKNHDLQNQNQRLDIARHVLEERAENLNDIKSKLYNDFNIMSRELVDKHASNLTTQSNEKLSFMLAPLNAQLGDFRKKVEEVYDLEAKERFSLRKEIDKMIGSYEKLHSTSENLITAFRGDNKTQGNWGEVQLEKILNEAGLRQGSDYKSQDSFKNEEGGRGQPDVVVYLPDNKHIIIDSKVNLVAYERYCNALIVEEKDAHLKDFILSVNKQIDGLSSKKYGSEYAGVNTPDFVIMFMPIEAAYILAVSSSPEIVSTAWNKKVVLVNPSTLFSTLRTIAHVRALEKQTKNVLQITEESRKMHDKFVGFVKDMENVGKHLDNSKASWEQALNKLSTGKGNLIRRADKLMNLGGLHSDKSLQGYLGEDQDNDQDNDSDSNINEIINK